MAGYTAGVFCAAMSHPADSIVSVLNKGKSLRAFRVLRKRVQGRVEGPVRPDHHDWHPDCAVVVHLRLRQGQPASPSHPSSTRIPKKSKNYEKLNCDLHRPIAWKAFTVFKEHDRRSAFSHLALSDSLPDVAD